MIDRFEIIVLGVCIAIGLGCVVVRADEPLVPGAFAQNVPVIEEPDCSGERCVHFGVKVTASDIAIKEMYGWCMLHLPIVHGTVTDNADWWPNPCNEVQSKYYNSGAQAKWEEIEKRDKANQLDMVKRGLGLAK
jgi:hypothetical protein